VAISDAQPWDFRLAARDRAPQALHLIERRTPPRSMVYTHGQPMLIHVNYDVRASAWSRRRSLSRARARGHKGMLTSGHIGIFCRNSHFGEEHAVEVDVTD
jgi:hypothetical protein